MLEPASLPRQYWAEAITVAAHTQAIHDTKSPFEVVTGTKPKVQHFKVFGCEAFAHVPKEKREKFEAKAVRCRFLGYVPPPPVQQRVSTRRIVNWKGFGQPGCQVQ